MHRTPWCETGLRFSAAVLVLTLAGCSQSTGGHPSAKSDAPVPASSGASASSDATSLPSPSESLSKADFVERMNAICADTNKQRDATSPPSGPTDFAGIQEYFTKTLALYLAYIDQAKALIAQTADRAELTTKWISLEEADFELGRPLIEKLIRAAAAKDAAKVTDLVSKFQDLPDHTTEIAGYMTSYGLTDCAKLENG